MLSLAFAGRWYENEFQKQDSLVEAIRHVRGQLEAIFRSLGIEMTIGESKNPFLHPGYRASVKSGRTTFGSFGLMHPQLKDALGVKQDLIFAELDAMALVGAMKEREYQPPVDFPSVRRDLTIKLSERDLSSVVARHIQDCKAANFCEVTVVDNFKKPEENFRRVTYRLTFQNSERTLESVEVETALQEILTVLKEKHQIELA
jgi:phenylalanyl-tRNA synthetase beta chain